MSDDARLPVQLAEHAAPDATHPFGEFQYPTVPVNTPT